MNRRLLRFLFHYAQQASFNLMTSKLRTGLAVLGILVGTGAIVALISCSQLATEKALAQFKTLGTNLIAVSVFQDALTHSPSAGGGEMPLAVWRNLSSLLPNVLRIAPYNTAFESVSFQGKHLSATLIGADESLANIVHIQLERGRFISFMESFERFCVIGHRLAQQMKQISVDDPIGQQLRIGKSLYTIVGVAAPWKESVFFNEDIEQSIILPIAGMILINKNTRVNNAIMLLKPDSHIDAVIEQIKQAIHIQMPHSNVFIRSAKQIINSMESQGRIFTLLLAVIGGIALLVGGIGVMNVMLITVSERKKEIGLRKAIGAKNRDIQSLFLFESIILSVLGGGLGILIGLFFTWIIAYFSQWSFRMYAIPPLIGFGVSVATGVFFGFYPARRAAQMEPIFALRND